jgi:hypothetical protein
MAVAPARAARRPQPSMGHGGTAATSPCDCERRPRRGPRRRQVPCPKVSARVAAASGWRCLPPSEPQPARALANHAGTDIVAGRGKRARAH